MAIALPCCGEHSIPVMDENAANDKEVWKQLKRLNDIVFWIELLEYSSNAIGTVAFLWATVVMLGGFCSLLSRLDFWFATIMVFIEGTRVFICKDASANQWLFGSTRTFRWDHFCFSGMHGHWNLYAVFIGASISAVPVTFGSQIITGVLKVAILAVTSQLLTRTHRGTFVRAVLVLFALVGGGGCLYWSFYSLHKFGLKGGNGSEKLSAKSSYALVGTSLGVTLVGSILKWKLPRYEISKSRRVFWIKVIMAAGLVCLPVLSAKLGSDKYKSVSICIAAALLIANWPKAMEEEEEQSSNALALGTLELLLKIVNTIMPILFFWGVMFPLPGISLNISFYMLLSVVAGVLVGNLQIPVAFLQILLSSLRLHRLLEGRDYHPLPDGASPNLVPSIVVFFVLELCQGSSNVLGIILGLISFTYRRWLLRDLKLKKKEQEWGAKAVNLYHHQACMALKEKGLFHTEESMPRSLDSLAVESLGCTSSEMQIVRLCVIHYYLQHGDSNTRSRLMAQITRDAAGMVTKITGTISHLIIDQEILTSHPIFNTGTLIEKLKLKKKQKEKQMQRQKHILSSISLSLKFVSRLAADRGKMGTKFRQELSDNPILLHSLQRILDLEVCSEEPRESYSKKEKEVLPSLIKEELRELAMNVLKVLALHDEAAAKENWTTHPVVPKLMTVFLNTDEDRRISLRQAAGEVLAYLTITSSDICRSILEVRGHDFMKNLINMLEDDNYISVAANILHNLCAIFGEDMLMMINLDAKEYLRSALRKVMQLIPGNKNKKQLNAALCVASQIGYVCPEDYALVLAEKLAPNTDAAAELVGKLVDTLQSHTEPNPEYPRLRRFLIGTAISIMESCPEYIKIFREKRAEDALKNLKGTSSRLEKFKVFVEGKGMVPETTAMQEVVDKAKQKLRPETNPN